MLKQLALSLRFPLVAVVFLLTVCACLTLSLILEFKEWLVRGPSAS